MYRIITAFKRAVVYWDHRVGRKVHGFLSFLLHNSSLLFIDVLFFFIVILVIGRSRSRSASAGRDIAGRNLVCRAIMVWLSSWLSRTSLVLMPISPLSILLIFLPGKLLWLLLLGSLGILAVWCQRRSDIGGGGANKLLLFLLFKPHDSLPARGHDMLWLDR